MSIVRCNANSQTNNERPNDHGDAEAKRRCSRFHHRYSVFILLSNKRCRIQTLIQELSRTSEEKEGWAFEVSCRLEIVRPRKSQFLTTYFDDADFAEHQLRREFKEKAMKICDVQINAFASCAKEEGVMVVFRCNEFSKFPDFGSKKRNIPPPLTELVAAQM